MLPSPKVLMGITLGASDDDSDDLADTLREVHGHMQTGNYKEAADAMRAAHAIMTSEKAPSGEDYDLYD